MTRYRDIGPMHFPPSWHGGPPDPPEEDPNRLLDRHHDVEGVSDFGDDISDHCATCGFAAGWREHDDRFGHDTQATVDEVAEWIASHDE